MKAAAAMAALLICFMANSIALPRLKHMLRPRKPVDLGQQNPVGSAGNKKTQAIETRMETTLTISGGGECK
ncbi:MAG: hypothetical protein GY844_24175 [Bradyrhizobium sp.]|nr:hypothetical protein [Bradyrhizobium sp.]